MFPFSSGGVHRSPSGPATTPSSYQWRFRTFYKHGVEHHSVPPYWPQANGHGEVERQNRSLLKALRIAVSGSPWQADLFRFLTAHRATPHSTTGKSPFELMCGRQMKTKLPAPRQPSMMTESVMQIGPGSSRGKRWNTVRPVRCGHFPVTEPRTHPDIHTPLTLHSTTYTHASVFLFTSLQVLNQHVWLCLVCLGWGPVSSRKSEYYNSNVSSSLWGLQNEHLGDGTLEE